MRSYKAEVVAIVLCIKDHGTAMAMSGQIEQRRILDQYLGGEEEDHTQKPVTFCPPTQVAVGVGVT